VKALAVLGLVGGLALATLLVLSYGIGAIWDASAAIGWGGSAAIVAMHLGLIGGMGLAWWLLGRGRPDARRYRFVWGRLIRDSASEALPLSQIGGFVLGARAVTLAGVSSSFAAGSTVVDVTVELVAQLVYTLLGLALLDYLQPQNAFALPVLAGLALMAGLVVAFVAVQARGAGFVERIGVQLARRFLGREIAVSGSVQGDIQAIHRRPGTLLTAACVHLTTWILSGVETWLTLWLMGVELPVSAGIAIDSLLYGVRSAAFMVPNAVGVQEGGFIVLGGLFGVGPDAALALSFVKRGRDLIIGVPALLVWQAIEGRRAWRAPVPPDAP
jgi:putative membrane protein